MENKLEQMGDFFNKRAETYDDHMINEVEGAREAYIEIAKYIPEKSTLRLVDLGCGTGLELKEIFQKNPDIKVTGIDLSDEMLEKLKDKYPGKSLELHNMSYFDFDYGKEQYEIAVSCETMHHFSHEDKKKLYTKLCEGIVPGGKYIECDYMAPDQETEDFYYAENRRIRMEQGITDGFYHYDTPCTAESQVKLLMGAGFSMVDKVWQLGNTVILVCDKKIWS